MIAKNVADIYPLSPIQQLTLLDSLAMRGGRGHFEQLLFTMVGDISPADILTAWQHVIGRHTVLRTAFVWRGLKRPQQVVYHDVSMPFAEFDLRSLADQDARARVEAYAAEERDQGIDLSRAPLMRLALFRTADDRCDCLWSYHPLLIDGWSTALALREFFESYEALRSGRRPPSGETYPFRDYIAWLRSQNLSDGESYWRETMSGIRRATPLAVDYPDVPRHATMSTATIEIKPGAETVDAIHRLVQGSKVTPNAIVQGAWSAVLSRLSGDDDVVFGTAVSGRPPTLRGATEILGPFFNNVPVRAHLQPDAPLSEWLVQLMRRQLDAGPFEHVPLSFIQEWSELESGDEPFHSLVLCHNLPFEGTFWEEGRRFHIENIDKDIRTVYPLTLVCVPKLGMLLRLIYDDQLFSPATAHSLLEGVSKLLSTLGDAQHLTVGQWAASFEPPPSLSLWRGRVAANTAVSAPRADARRKATDLEGIILAVWESVLGIDSIGLDDNLFDLGIRSIKLEQAHAKLLKEGFTELTLIDLFEYPTVAKLASKLAGANPLAGTTISNQDASKMAEKIARNRARRKAARV